MDKNLRRKILKGSAATSIGTVSGLLLNFVAVMIMTRYAPKEDLGIFVLVIVIVNMFNILSGLGVELTLVKFIASQKEEEKQEVLLPVLIIRTLGTLLLSILFLLVARYFLSLFDDRIYKYVWYILAIFILANYRDLFYSLMQGINLWKQFSIVNVVSSAFRVIIFGPFLLLGKIDIKILLIIEILSTAQPLIHQLLVIPFKNYLHTKPTRHSMKKIINFSIPIYLNNLVVFVNGQLNIFILGIYLSPISVANYDVARKLPTALKKMFGAFIAVYFPNLAGLFSTGDKKTAVNLIERSLGTFSILTTLLFVFSFLFRNELTSFLFSKKYVEVSMAFALLILNFYIRGLGDLMGYPFVPAGYPSVPTWINALASIISIGLSILFIPIYGYFGIVYALLIMNIVSTSLFYFYLSKYQINPQVKSFLKPTILFLIAPISMLFGGQYLLIIKLLLFSVALIIGWLISDDLKSITGHTVSYVQKYIPFKKFEG